MVQTTEKSKTFGTVSAITTEGKQDDEQIKKGATASHEKTTSLELGDLMAKLEQIDKKLKCNEEDRQMLKKGYTIQQEREPGQFLQPGKGDRRKVKQMSDKVEATDKEREKHIKRTFRK